MNENFEFFKKRWESEQPAFARVIKAMPGDECLGYKPHEKNTCAGDLAWQLVQEQGQLTELLKAGEIDFKLTPAPKEHSVIVDSWDKATENLRNALAKSDASNWNEPARFLMDGKVVWETKMSDMFWGYLFDMVHHRGQLSTYLRPMGGKVPSIYGPTADEPGV